jgi:hypothetical protein
MSFLFNSHDLTILLHPYLLDDTNKKTKRVEKNTCENNGDKFTR